MVKYFQVGQTVWDVVQGKGEVISTSHTIYYPICVQFEKIIQLYCNDGRFHENHQSISLYQTAPIITPNVPIIEFEQGELVLVRNLYEWVVRYYSHFENGKHYCFNNQQTKGEVTPWKETIKITNNSILPSN